MEEHLPLRLADAVHEVLDVRVLFDGLFPVPRVRVGSRLVLELICRTVGNVRVGALLLGVALEEVACVVLLRDGAGVAFIPC